MPRRTSKPKATPDPAATREAGLRILSRRDHSTRELARKLSRRGHPEDSVSAVLDRFRAAGYLDDAKFARSLVRRRAATRGPQAIAAELASLGVDRSAAAAALAELGPEHQLVSATRIAERLYDALVQPTFRDALDKIGPKLVRRGFSGQIAQAACLAAHRRDHPAA